MSGRAARPAAQAHLSIYLKAFLPPFLRLKISFECRLLIVVFPMLCVPAARCGRFQNAFQRHDSVTELEICAPNFKRRVRLEAPVLPTVTQFRSPYQVSGFVAIIVGWFAAPSVSDECGGAAGEFVARRIISPEVSVDPRAKGKGGRIKNGWIMRLPRCKRLLISSWVSNMKKIPRTKFG